MRRPASLTPAQQEETTVGARRALSSKNWRTNYNVGISTIRRATRPA
jgi:hypothetical protein